MSAPVAEQFKDALRLFPSGVTIVTLKSGEERHGLTVSAFASVSADPPLVAVMIDRRHRAHRLLADPGAVFAINILGHDHSELSNRFAWTKGEDRFAIGDWRTAATGAPVLADALAWLDCTVHARVPAGTHTIHVGRVRRVEVPRPEAAPLVYWNRDYRRLDSQRAA